MVGRTHDLAAITAITYIIATSPIPKMSLATAVVALSATMIGGLTPDIDQPTAPLWRSLPAGSIIGRLVSPFLGGHRFLSHSLLGILLFSFLSEHLLAMISSVLLVNMHIVWECFMIGFISHLVMDTFTREGVPWLFPFPFHFGIPPLKFFRIKTGGIIEKAVIFPGLLVVNFFLIHSHSQKFLTFLHNYIH